MRSTFCTHIAFVAACGLLTYRHRSLTVYFSRQLPVLVQVTGRILVLPPNAVLYLLHMNKKWGDNKSGMEDYFDFEKLRASKGLETILRDFATTDNGGPLLAKPVPNNDVNLLRKPLWDYLDSACYSQNWSPGKLYVGFNISMLTSGADVPGDTDPNTLVGTFDSTDPARLEEFSLKRKSLSHLRVALEGVRQCCSSPRSVCCGLVSFLLIEAASLCRPQSL
jgi:hypothetical protein